MLKVTWFVPPAIHIVAKRRGILARSDLMLDAVQTASSDEQYEDLCAGRRDVAVTAMDNVIAWNRRGRFDDFRIVAQVEATTALSLVSKPGFENVAALKNCHLLVDSAENGFVVALRALLHDAGVSFDECTISSAGGVKQRLSSLVEGLGDATLLGSPFTEMAEQAGLRRLADVDKLYPEFPGQGVVVRAANLLACQDELGPWLDALEQARGICRSETEIAIADLLEEGAPPALAASLVGAVGGDLMPATEGLRLLIGQRRALGLVGGDATDAELVDMRFFSQPSNR